MNAHTPSQSDQLRAVKASLDAIAPGDWTRAHDERGGLIEARGCYGERFELARFDDRATIADIEFACNAPAAVRFLLDLLARAFAEIHELRGEPAHRSPPAGEAVQPQAKNFAAECALKCKDARFKVYLEECHGLERPLTDERVAQRVRSVLGVQSRKELNDGGQAAEAWKQLRADFAAWLKAER